MKYRFVGMYNGLVLTSSHRTIEEIWEELADCCENLPATQLSDCYIMREINGERVSIVELGSTAEIP